MKSKMKHNKMQKKSLPKDSLYVCVYVYTYTNTNFWMLSEYIPVTAMMWFCITDE